MQNLFKRITTMTTTTIKEGVLTPAPKYTFNPIPLPPDFLTSTLAQPITLRRIDFTTTALPEYKFRRAFILDNVLSTQECTQLLALAEAASTLGWQQAMVSATPELEVLHTSYRNSDRLIWDQQEVVDRIWARVEDSGVLLVKVQDDGANDDDDGGGLLGDRQKRWVFEKLNPRMRFLRYGAGQFFRREFFWLHLLLLM